MVFFMLQRKVAGEYKEKEMRKCLVAMLLLCTLAMREQLCAELTEGDKAKLQVLVAQYPGAKRKETVINQINELRKKYVQDKDALVAIEAEYSSKLTDLAASYEASRKEKEKSERNAILDGWMQSPNKKGIEKEIARVAKNLRSQSRFLAALELEEGFEEKKKKYEARHFPVDHQKLYREGALPAVMQNLDDGIYQEGTESTPQRLFWRIQRLVQAANTYLLLNVIPASHAHYTDLRTSIENLIVVVAHGKKEDISTAFDKLKSNASKVQEGIQAAITRRKNISTEDVLFIQPEVFKEISNILTAAQKINFDQLVQAIIAEWGKLDAKEQVNIDTTELLKARRDETNQTRTAYAAFKQYYNLIQNHEMSKHAALFGIARPDTFDGLLWRQIPPITELSADLLAFDKIRYEGDLHLHPERARPVHHMMYELQSLVAAATTLKQKLEKDGEKPHNIHRILYPLRKQINQLLTNLQFVILELHHDLDEKTKVVSDELLILAILADVSIFSSFDNVKKPNVPKTNESTLEQAIQGVIEEKNRMLMQTQASSKILYEKLQTIRKEIFTSASVQNISEKLTGAQELTKKEQEDVIKKTTTDFLAQDLQGLQLYKCICDLQTNATYKEKLKKFITDAPTDIKDAAANFITRIGGLAGLLTKTSFSSEALTFGKGTKQVHKKDKWETVKTYLIITLVVIVIIAAVVGLMYLSCGVIAPALGYPWWYGLFFSPTQMCWFKVLGLKKSSYPAQPEKEREFITPQTARTALCTKFIEDTPEFIVEWELTSILFDLLVSKKVISGEKSTILTIIRNSAWQHLTMARKAIEKIKDTQQKTALTNKLQEIRTELRTYFDTQRGTTQTA
jgi:hypothetical protein